MVDNNNGEHAFAPGDIKADDTLAEEEAMKLNSGEDLEQQGKKKEHERHQQFRDNLNLATLIIFWVIVICVVWGIVTYTFHILTPDNWHYLGDDQLDQLRSILATAILSSALTGYANKQMA